MGSIFKKFIPVISASIFLLASFVVWAQNDDTAAIKKLMEAYHTAIFGDLYVLNEEPFVTPRHLTRTEGNIVELIGYPEYNAVLLEHATLKLGAIEVTGHTAMVDVVITKPDTQALLRQMYVLIGDVEFEDGYHINQEMSRAFAKLLAANPPMVEKHVRYSLVKSDSVWKIDAETRLFDYDAEIAAAVAVLDAHFKGLYGDPALIDEIAGTATDGYWQRVRENLAVIPGFPEYNMVLLKSARYEIDSIVHDNGKIRVRILIDKPDGQMLAHEVLCRTRYKEFESPEHKEQVLKATYEKVFTEYMPTIYRHENYIMVKENGAWKIDADYY